MSSPFFDRGMSISITEAPECNICSERYDDTDEDFIPRNLACGHSLCSKCITKCMAHGGVPMEGGNVSITCPNKCRQPTVVPQGNVQNLPKNFAVLEIIYGSRERMQFFQNRSTSSLTRTQHSSEYICDVCESSGAVLVCPSCAVYLCQSCSDDIHSRKGYHVHLLIPVSEFMNSSEDLSTSIFSHQSSLDMELHHCKAHTSEPVEYICEVCCEEVCRMCHVSGDHRDHDCRLLTDVASEKRDALRRMIDEVNQCHTNWNKGYDDCQELREHLFMKKRELEGDIKSRFHGIHSQLHAQEEQLLSLVHCEIDSRSRMLISQADQLAKVCSIAKNLVEDCDRLLNGTASEVVRQADHVLAQAHQYVRSEQDTSPLVSDCIEVDFSAEEKLAYSTEKLRQLRIAPGRVLDVQVKATGVNELLLSWKPPQDYPPEAVSYVAECSAGNGPYRMVYEGRDPTCLVEGCTTDGDTVCRFRVAAVNDVGMGPYSMPLAYTQRKASFLWDATLKHRRAHISNNGYTVSIGENATWVSVGTNTVLSHGSHYWEVVLDRYGSPSMSRKVVIGVVNSSYHHWHRSHGVIGIKTCPIGNRSWGLACGIAKKLSSRSTFLASFGGKHNLFHEGDAVGVFLDLNKGKLSFYRNGEPLGLEFTDVYGPVIPAISFCRNKALTLRFPSPPEDVTVSETKTPQYATMKDHTSTAPILVTKPRSGTL